MAGNRLENVWELSVCGWRGHVTYAPDEPAARDHVHGTSSGGDLWRCLRCGEFVLGAPRAAGPRGDAPIVLRGKALRGVLIVRVLAVERALRAVLLVLAAWAVWTFRGAQGSIQATLDRDLPLLRASGFKVDEMTAVHELEKALAAKPSALMLLVLGLSAYAAIELIEGIGLWLLKRWGEYFAVVATSVFLPLEIYDIATKGLSLTRALTLAINVLAVLYLVVSKRLFGLRGGRAAYDAERRSEQVLDEVPTNT